MSRNLLFSLARLDLLVSGAGLTIGGAVSGVDRPKCVIGHRGGNSQGVDGTEVHREGRAV